MQAAVLLVGTRHDGEISSHTDETSEVTAEIGSSIETAGLNVGAFRIVVRNSAIDPKRTMPTKRRGSTDLSGTAATGHRPQACCRWVRTTDFKWPVTTPDTVTSGRCGTGMTALNRGSGARIAFPALELPAYRASASGL